MYKIMTLVSKRKDYESLYKFLTETTETDEGEEEIKVVDLKDKVELDAKVESMLNDEGYSKSDFIVVKVVDYTINAKDYTDGETVD